MARWNPIDFCFDTTQPPINDWQKRSAPHIFNPYQVKLTHIINGVYIPYQIHTNVTNQQWLLQETGYTPTLQETQNTFGRLTASTVIIYPYHGCLAMITAHNTDFHYKRKRKMLNDIDDKKVFEYRPIDHMPLLADGVLASSKDHTGHLATKDFMILSPALLIINHNYHRRTNQIMFQQTPVLLKVIQELIKYTDTARKELDVLQTKVKVCIFFI